MSIFSNKSKKTAAIISYISLVISTLSSMVLTSIILETLGDDGYGLYQMIYSLASNLMILDLGIGTVMIRYIAEYRAKGDTKGESNFAAMMRIMSAVSAIIVAILCGILTVFIGEVYPKLSDGEVATSQIMLLLMTVQFVVTIFSHFTTGYIQAYERFVYTSVKAVANIVITFALTVFFLKLNFGCIGIVVANVSVVVMSFLCDAVVLRKILCVKIKLYQWDRSIILPAVGLMVAMFLQSIVGHINSSADKTILGIMCEKSDVAIYSIAATIITMFNTIPTVLSGFFQPQVTRMITKGEGVDELGKLVARVGRIQFMFCTAILGAFFLFGKDFLQLWVGKSIAPMAWLIVMIIIPFNMIPLIQTICLSILNGYNKRLYRSIILASMTLINVVVTIVLIKILGPIGAPIGTAFSYLIGHVILLNIYYQKVIKLDVLHIFQTIFSRTWICFLSSVVISYPFTMWRQVNALSFVIKCSVFCLVYFILIYYIGMNKSEKILINSYLNKLFGRKKKNVT